MKRDIVTTLLIAVVAILAYSSCGKEEEPQTQPAPKCNCGIVEMRCTDQSGNPYFMVKNNCSEKTKKFYVDWGDWNNTKTGDEVCFSNVESWK